MCTHAGGHQRLLRRRRVHAGRGRRGSPSIRGCEMRRVVVFGGVAAVQRLDRLLRHDDDVEIVLVSNSNFLSYTPMLSDVAGGTIEPRHAVPALRTFLKKARLRVATVEGIDLARRTVQGTLL